MFLRDRWAIMGEAKMASALALLVLFSLAAIGQTESVLHKKTFHSEPFELGPGDVTDTYRTMDFPKGHIAMRSFDAEVVDEQGNSVPLTDVYLHHWVVLKLRVKKGHKDLLSSSPKHLDMKRDHRERMAFREGADVLQSESGMQGTCIDNQDISFFGLGSETRHTNTTVPAPYGRVVGDPASIPEGYEEAWYLNIHAINTREVVDRISCLECLCESYGVTTDRKGDPLPENYRGGMLCCVDKTQCAVREDSNGAKRKYYLKYTVTWVDYDSSVVPVRLYLIDVTDPRTSLSEKPICKIEYEVPKCNEPASNGCFDRRQSIAAVPVGGDLIHGSLHQHSGGLGGMVYYKGGAPLCSSEPIYGKGNEPGDEAGYVVGMTSCYPEPGTVKTESMKELSFEAFYSNEVAHTGVMSIFGLVVADPIPYFKEVTETTGTK